MVTKSKKGNTKKNADTLTLGISKSMTILELTRHIRHGLDAMPIEEATHMISELPLDDLYNCLWWYEERRDLCEIARLPLYVMLTSEEVRPAYQHAVRESIDRIVQEEEWTGMYPDADIAF